MTAIIEFGRIAVIVSIGELQLYICNSLYENSVFYEWLSRMKKIDMIDPKFKFEARLALGAELKKEGINCDTGDLYGPVATHDQVCMLILLSASQN